MSRISCTPLSRFLFDFSWDVELGSYGFYKVLCVIDDLTRRREFYLTTVERDYDHVDKLLQIIFAENDTLERFPATFWRVRWMQIECISNLLRFESTYAAFAESPAGKDWLRGLSSRGVRLYVLSLSGPGHERNYMDKIKRLLTDYIWDADARVRSATGRASALLLRIRRWKHASIYTALLDNMDVSIVAEAARPERHPDREQGSGGRESPQQEMYMYEEDPLRVVTTALTLARLAVHSAVLLPQALLDLCRLCSSRSALHRGAFGVDAAPAPLHCFSSLLTRLLLFISRELGYTSPKALLLDHLRFMLAAWTQPPEPQGEADVEGRRPPPPPPRVLLCLSDFPFFAMRLTGRYSYSDFLLEHGDVILPSICQVTDIAARWRLAQGNPNPNPSPNPNPNPNRNRNPNRFAQELAKCAGYGTSDPGMAKLFSHLAPAVWGCEYPYAVRQGLGFLPAGLGLPDTQMSQFFARIVPGERIRARLLIQSASDALQAHALCYAEMPMEAEQRFPVLQAAPVGALYAPAASHWLPMQPYKAIGKHLTALADALAAEKTNLREPIEGDTQLRKFRSSFLQRCVNVLEIAAALRRRMLETRRERVRLNILACLTALLRYDKQQKQCPSLASMRALVNVALCAVQTTSHHAVIITASRLLAQIAEQWGPNALDFEGLDSMGELFCELVGLSAALNSCLGRLAGSEQCGCDEYAAAAYSSLLAAAQDVCIGTPSALLPLPLPPHTAASATTPAAAPSLQEEWTRELSTARDVVHAAMLTLLATAQDVSQDNGNSRRGVPLNPLLRSLPVPRVYLPALSADIRAALADLERSDGGGVDFGWRIKVYQAYTS